MREHTIQIETGKCTGCGLCREDCPSGNISLENGKAAVLSQRCIQCGHCVAVCPQGAVSMTGFDEQPVDLSGKTTLEPDQLLEALRSRRSIRKFKAQPVPSQILRQVVEAGRLTPTAKNAQDLSYFVLQERLAACEKEAVRLFRRLLPFASLAMPEARRMEVDDHFFFKKAPAAIVIATKDTVSGALAASNMALAAEACGLGVLYSGFFTIAANHSRALRRLMGLKKPAVTTLVLGYPNVAYRRTAPKEPADVRYL